jgi:hypothetical protein
MCRYRCASRTISGFFCLLNPRGVKKFALVLRAVDSIGCPSTQGRMEEFTLFPFVATLLQFPAEF